MSTLTSFSQGALLSNTTTNPLTQHGICVALCDYWLTLIKNDPDAAPSDRLQQLQQYVPQAMNHQRTYARLRQQHGREEARRQVGAPLGLQYDGQTMVMKEFLGMSGIRHKLAADLRTVGSAVTWTLRFADGSGHAIAGFCGLSGQQPILKYRLRLFDPNIGEYEGTLQELDVMLDNLLRHPMYRTVTGVHRTSEG